MAIITAERKALLTCGVIVENMVFKADFEVFGPDDQELGNAKVDFFVAVK